MLLDQTSVASFGTSRTFAQEVAINSLDFHRTEDRLVTANDEAGIRVYRCGRASRRGAAAPPVRDPSAPPRPPTYTLSPCLHFNNQHRYRQRAEAGLG